MFIQIVEDDRALSEGIVLALKEPGTEFIQNGSITEAKKAFEGSMPDLIILDVNLPDGSGYDYLKWAKSRAGMPVLILTARDMEMEEVMGLTLGADDYMTKPFSLAVLRARIQVLLRRGKGQSVNEQRLLKLFVENRGRVLTRGVLIDRLWSDGGEYVDENALSVTVNRLRGKRIMSRSLCQISLIRLKLLAKIFGRFYRAETVQQEEGAEFILYLPRNY